MNGSMKGIKVLDFAMGIAGPSAGLMCAQYGADVVKIEPPTGDWGRVLGNRHGDLTAYSTIYNRGKRSLAVDLKDAQAREVISCMAQQADVVIESYRPGVMKKFGLDYETVRKANPGVIYLSVSGFGQSGPLTHLRATDIVLQALSGFMDMNKDRKGMPRRVDLAIMDIITGLYAFQAISNALLERQRFGSEGRYIDCSMMKSAIALQAPRMVEHALQGELKALYAPIGTLPTKDSVIVIGVMYEDHYAALCRAIEREDLITDPRYSSASLRVENEEDLMDILAVEFRKRTTEDWVQRLAKAGVLHSRALNYSQLLKEPQVVEAKAVTWMHQDGFEAELPVANVPGAPPVDPARQAPHIGQQSRAILQEFGIAPEAIDALVARGAVKEAAHG